MLASLQEARVFWHPGDEVLCSWNASAATEAEIQPAARSESLVDAPPSFRIAQRQAYHFATNMNALARQAHGELLLLLNDDVILDPGSIDRAMQILGQDHDVGVVGGRLRSSAGRLSHAGLLFSNQGIPYNRFRPQLGPLIDPNGLDLLESGPMPAVTGALMLLRRADFLAVGGLRESFRVCGEDIALCLDLWQQLGKTPYYASDVTGIHDEKSTRGDTPDHHDIQAVGQLAAPLCSGDASFQARQSHWALQESNLLCRVSEQQWQTANCRQQELDQLQEQSSQLKQQWAEERLALLGQITALRRHVGELTSSSSWKITRPWRVLGRWFAPPNDTHAE